MVPVKLSTRAPGHQVRAVVIAAAMGLPIALSVTACSSGSSTARGLTSARSEPGSAQTRSGSSDAGPPSSKGTTAGPTGSSARSSNDRPGRRGAGDGRSARADESGANPGSGTDSGTTAGTEATSRPDPAKSPAVVAEMPSGGELATIDADLAALDQELADAQVSLAQIESEP